MLCVCACACLRVHVVSLCLCAYLGKFVLIFAITISKLNPNHSIAYVAPPRAQAYDPPRAQAHIRPQAAHSSQGVFNVAFEMGFHPTLRHRAPVEAGLGVLDGGQVELHSDKLASSVEGCLYGLLVPRLFPDGKQTLNIHGRPVARERVDGDALEGRVAAAVLLPERDGGHGLGRLLDSGVAELPSLVLVLSKGRHAFVELGFGVQPQLSHAAEGCHDLGQTEDVVGPELGVHRVRRVVGVRLHPLPSLLQDLLGGGEEGNRHTVGLGVLLFSTGPGICNSTVIMAS